MISSACPEISAARLPPNNNLLILSIKELFYLHRAAVLVHQADSPQLGNADADRKAGNIAVPALFRDNLSGFACILFFLSVGK